jgi:hypothetical protein
VFTSLLAGDCLTTHSFLQLTPRLATISLQPPIFLTAVSQLSRNSSCSSSYSLGTDRIEITASNSSCCIACVTLCKHYLSKDPHATIYSIPRTVGSAEHSISTIQLKHIKCVSCYLKRSSCLLQTAAHCYSTFASWYCELIKIHGSQFLSIVG